MSDQTTELPLQRDTGWREHPDFANLSDDELAAEDAIIRNRIKWAVEDEDRERWHWYKDQMSLLNIERARRKKGGNKKRRESQADLLVKIVEDSGAKLFHTTTDEQFIIFPAAAHNETWPIRSRAARRWITHRFYSTLKKAPNSEAMQSALNGLEARGFVRGRRTGGISQGGTVRRRSLLRPCRRQLASCQNRRARLENNN